LKKKYQILRYIFFDFSAAVIAWVFFFIERKNLLGENLEGFTYKLFGNAFLVAIYWILFYSLFGLYSDVYRKSRASEWLKLIPITFFGCVIIFFLLLLDDRGVYNYTDYYKTFTAYFILHFSITSLVKMIEITRVRRLIRDKKISFNTLLIGSNVLAKDIFYEIQKSYELHGLKFIGYVHVDKDSHHIFNGSLKNLGDYKEIANIIKESKVEQVIIAIESSEHKKVTEILNLIESSNVKISIIPDIYQILIGSVKVNQIFDIPLIEINKDLSPVWQKVLKRMLDIVGSLAVFILGFPFFIVLISITKFTSRGPVFFSQERIGKDGIPFKMFKFRSMFVNAEPNGPTLSSQNDPRISPWGRVMRKTRIDELPQFYNVLIGDMSIVGPRPEREYFIQKIVEVAPYYRHLHRVRPGITSLGQVKFGYAENVEEMVKRLKYDIIYIENISLVMDFRIIFYTLLIVFQGRGK
jgi:exopolysaccharide biosynthesis polyprenyl glycosylphosphotransferase